MRTRHHIFFPLHPGKSILCSCCMVLIVCLFTACDSKQSTSTKPTLTVTLEPLRYFTETIAGDKFKIVSMVPKGSSPETYDPTPQQLVNLDKSTAYLRIGYIGFDGNLNQAITIRTFLSRDNVLHFQAGAGIVAKSDPESEPLEGKGKLGALRKAIELANELKN